MSQAQTGLPAPWTVRYSKSKNLPYYYNPITNASQWEPPADANPDLLSTYMQKHFSSPQPVEPNPGDDKIRCAHLLVKHRESRRPSSWKENEIRRTKQEARQMIEKFEERIRNKEAELGELASKESDCSSARKKGDL
jgi:peptidyl-prolyl cis-trans isomerase NIMA-interacting 1